MHPCRFRVLIVPGYFRYLCGDFDRNWIGVSTSHTFVKSFLCVSVSVVEGRLDLFLGVAVVGHRFFNAFSKFVQKLSSPLVADSLCYGSLGQDWRVTALDDPLHLVFIEVVLAFVTHPRTNRAVFTERAGGWELVPFFFVVVLDLHSCLIDCASPGRALGWCRG